MDKKDWRSPEITDLGTVEELTQKYFGADDGVLFGPPGQDGVPIGPVS